LQCYIWYLRFGERKQIKGDTPAYSITHNGFTGHEEVEPFKLVHMDGRLYDPVLGRFLSADPTVQAPNDPQDLNRYSYCVNNPLRFTDPSGFGIFDWVSDIISDICDIISDVVNVICDVICDVVRTVCDVVSSICSSKFIGTILELAVAAIATACSAGTLTMAYIMAATSAAVTLLVLKILMILMLIKQVLLMVMLEFGMVRIPRREKWSIMC